jgi:hypothetical protein
MELRSALEKVNQRIPSEIVKVSQIINDLISKVNTDFIETTNELKMKSAELEKIKKQLEVNKSQKNAPETNQDKGNDPQKKFTELQKEIEELKNKKQGLENAQVSLEHLLFPAKQCESKITQKITESKKGFDALTQFESIANNYLSISSSSSGHSPVGIGSSDTNYTNRKAELVGDTLHINNQNTSITQIDIDDAIKSTKNFENQKAQKISFSEVSQSSFSILEKNGFTIQKIEPNKYSAYKEI